MFKIGEVYKHVNCLDICFRVATTEEQSNGDIRLTGLWLNQHYDMMIICEDDILIKKEKIKEWKHLKV